MSEDKRKRCQSRLSALRTERASWDGHWREIAQFLLPRAGRFSTNDRNRGGKRHQVIYDNTGTRAVRTLAAGMMAGLTSPARPWFKLTTLDSDLMEYGPVKTWLADVTTLMRSVFHRSNTYRALHTMYEELGAFGVAASPVQRDRDDVIRHMPQTIGQYYLATDDRGVVDTFVREMDMTVAQMVEKFGRDVCSTTVQNLYDRGSYDEWVPVVQIVEPRRRRNRQSGDAANMPWCSIYFEPGGASDKLLRESGFPRFPVLAPRWHVTGGDVYGSSPGMDAIGDVKQLQQEQMRKGQAIDFQTKPALQGPSSLKDFAEGLRPGEYVVVDAAGPQSGIRPAFEVRLDLAPLHADILDVRSRVNAAFYADLFLMLASREGDPRMTATEVAERQEEKLLMLGPTIERLGNELLDPLIDLTFDEMASAGMLPPPPPELEDQDLDVEYVSMLAQAQRAVGINSTQRLLGLAGGIAQAIPDVLDKIDADQVIDDAADQLGVSPHLIRSDDKVRAMREERARAAQQAAAMQNAMAAAQTAKTMADTPTDGDNLLTDATAAFSGYT